MKLTAEDKRMILGYAAMMTLSLVGLFTANILLVAFSFIGYYVVDSIG
jgi:hypothetical protein